MKRHNVYFLFYILILLGCNHTKIIKNVDLEKIGDDYLYKLLEYSFELDLINNQPEIYKIFAYYSKTNDFIPDFLGNEYFETTELYYYGSKENMDDLMEQSKKYWSNINTFFFDVFGGELSTNQIFDNNIMTRLYYEMIKSENGKDKTKNVIIVLSKDELEYIEKNYINSKYLQEIEKQFFEEYILVLISFNFVGWQYPKNWKIDNNDNRYTFTVEIWDQERENQLFSLNQSLFLIKIKK